MSIQETEGETTILIVEDDATMAQMIGILLEREGYSAVIAQDGKEALEMLGLDEPARPELPTWPDLVLLDILLPGRDGFEVCSRLREEGARQGYIPIIMLTALGSLTDKVKGLNSGADDYIAKPFKNEELLARVRAMLRIKRLHDELKQAEERYRLLFENSPHLIAQIDREGRYLTVNPAMARSFGVSVEELTGKKLVEVAPEVAHARVEIVGKALDEEQIQSFEDERQGRCFHSVIVPFKVPGQEETVQVIVRDVSERKQAEEALKESKSKLDSVLLSIDDLVFAFDEEGRFTLCFSPRTHLFVPPDEFLGKKHSEVMPPHIDDLFAEAFDRNRKGQVAEYDY